MNPELARPEPQKLAAKYDGFTWVQSILGALILIAILAGLINPSIGSGIPAEAVETRMILGNLKAACENYVTEYNLLPASPENYVLIDILFGNDRKEGDPQRNPRGIAFITLSPKYLSPNQEVLDGWGTPLRVIFHPKDSRVSVFSAGKDRIFYTKDDILSWK